MKDVIQKVLKGDRDAYRAIVKEYGSAVRACLAGHLSSTDTVEDLAQETFVAAYEHLREFKLDQDFGPWIKGIARNKLLMHLRRSYQHGAALEKLRAQAAQEVFDEVARRQDGDDAQAIDRLRRCFEKLPQRLSGVLQSRYYERQSVTRIAERHGTSVSAISSLLFRGRKELQACMARSRTP
ncbi:MAG: sigma-70 family RNA polymerase sigma factor [Planctomycetaceae bacterium]|nr:sigma-70 family RNA polymerase sigma factor [Planctomycetaceae bacterium]